MTQTFRERIMDNGSIEKNDVSIIFKNLEDAKHYKEFLEMSGYMTTNEDIVSRDFGNYQIVKRLKKRIEELKNPILEAEIYTRDVLQGILEGENDTIKI